MADELAKEALNSENTNNINVPYTVYKPKIKQLVIQVEGGSMNMILTP